MLPSRSIKSYFRRLDLYVQQSSTLHHHLLLVATPMTRVRYCPAVPSGKLNGSGVTISNGVIIFSKLSLIIICLPYHHHSPSIGIRKSVACRAKIDYIKSRRSCNVILYRHPAIVTAFASQSVGVNNQTCRGYI